MTEFKQDFRAFELACETGNKEDILRELILLAPLQSLSNPNVGVRDYVEGTDNPQLRLAISTLNEEASATLRNEYSSEELPLPDTISVNAQFDVEEILKQPDFKNVVNEALLANGGELIKKGFAATNGLKQGFCNALLDVGITSGELKNVGGISATDMAVLGTAEKSRSIALGA